MDVKFMVNEKYSFKLSNYARDLYQYIDPVHLFFFKIIVFQSILVLQLYEQDLGLILLVVEELAIGLPRRIRED